MRLTLAALSSTADHAMPANPRTAAACSSLPVSLPRPAPWALPPVASVAYGASLTKAQRDRLTPDQVMALMKDGNERFRLERCRRTTTREQQSQRPANIPAADDTGLHRLACAGRDHHGPRHRRLLQRSGGWNVVNDDILGSMEFACKLAGAKIVLVMGHTACGAIKGAIDDVQLGNLTGLLARIRPAVERDGVSGERSAKNDDFVDAVARKNIGLTMANIRHRSAVLAELESRARSRSSARCTADIRYGRVLQLIRRSGRGEETRRS